MTTGNWLFALLVVTVITLFFIPAYMEIRKEKRLDRENKGKTTRIIKRWMDDGSERYFCQWFNHSHGDSWMPYGWNTYGNLIQYDVEGHPEKGFETIIKAEVWWVTRENKRLLRERMRAKKVVCVKEPIVQ